MKYYIIRTNHAVPVGYYRFIHVGYIFEGPVAEPILVWLKCVSDVKNTLLPSNL